MPLYKYRIQVKGTFSKKGFGFSCMRLAYQNNVTGTLFYESDNSVILEITGDEQDVDRITQICKKDDFVTDIHILGKTKTDKKLTDFIMLNQID